MPNRKDSEKIDRMIAAQLRQSDDATKCSVLKALLTDGHIDGAPVFEPLYDQKERTLTAAVLAWVNWRRSHDFTSGEFVCCEITKEFFRTQATLEKQFFENLRNTLEAENASNPN